MAAASDWRAVRVCLAYDCLYPYTVGGAERWYRNLAERLAAEGHEVTYATRLQWEPSAPPQIDGVRVLAVSRAEGLYGPDGNRRIGQALRFGRGMLGHLLRHGREYDVVHLCSFPYFSVLAAALARPGARYRIVVDWFEVWSPQYWRGYLGPVGGRVGLAVQRLCARVPQRAHCFSQRHAARLEDQGLRGEPLLVGGLYAGSLEPPRPRPAEPFVLFAGRHIPEKRVPSVVAAVGHARARGLEVRGLILGDGPERPAARAAIAALGLEDVVEAPGFVDPDDVDDAMRRALCLLHPSAREGYGLVVVEAAAHGTPAIVVDGPDNAAVELIESGVNGIVARSSDPEDLAESIVAVHEAGIAMRERTCAWFAENARRLSLETSIGDVIASYGSSPADAADGPPPVAAWRLMAGRAVRLLPTGLRSAYLRRARARRRSAEHRGG